MAIRPPEILLQLGSFEIHTYGVIIAAAMLIALGWADRRASRWGLNPGLASDAFFWAIIGAFIGARLGFVLQELSYFRGHLAEIPAVWTGGLSFHGGLAGGIMAGLLLLKQRRALGQFWTLADGAAGPLLLGAAIGRLGNWANQELYGYPTNLPWAIAIDPAHRLADYASFASFHPTFAYELLLNLFGLLILLAYEKKLSLHAQSFTGNPGQSFLFAIAWYGLARGLTEIWRISDRLVGPLSLAQLVSLVMIATAIGLWWAREAIPKRRPVVLD